jgi:hypothetical protein
MPFTLPPAFGSELAQMRPLGLIAVTLAGGGSGVSALIAQTAMGDGDRNERSHNTSENSVQNRAFQSRNF